MINNFSSVSLLNISVQFSGVLQAIYILEMKAHFPLSHASPHFLIDALNLFENIYYYLHTHSFKGNVSSKVTQQQQQNHII